MKGLSLILLVPFLLLLGCIDTGNAGNKDANLVVGQGDLVSVNYVGLLQDGTVFDTSLKEVAQRAGLPLRQSYAPLEFTVGSGQMIRGFDSAVIGMKVGESKTVTIPPQDAYGEKKENLVVSVPRENIRGGEVKVGSVVDGSDGTSGRVIEITATAFLVDFNHPLAGKTLVFNITLLNVTRLA